jgi:hypothetical protein
MLFVVFCPLQLGQGSGVAQGSSVTDDSGTRRRRRFVPLGFLDDEGAVAVPADVDFSQERFHRLDGVLQMTRWARQGVLIDVFIALLAGGRAQTQRQGGYRYLVLFVKAKECIGEITYSCERVSGEPGRARSHSMVSAKVVPSGRGVQPSSVRAFVASYHA